MQQPSHNMQLFEGAMEALRVPPSDWAVPFMIVGDQVMIGGDEILRELPRRIEKHLAAGGVDFPSRGGVSARAATPSSKAVCPPTTTDCGTRFDHR